MRPGLQMRRGRTKPAAADGDLIADSLLTEDGLQQTPSDKPDKEAQQPAPVSLTIPESSCSKVVGAKDYGVADKTYLSPDDTVYNTDKEGLFAPDGTYYSLQEVDDSYFADALMIGDSRTVGLYEYGDMADVTSFLARESSTIYDLFDDDEKMEYTPRGKESKERTLKDLLKKTKFSKIYISVGVNELGVPDTKDYYNEFREVIKKINKLQPDAIIYIQGIMHVSKKMSSSDPVYNNKAIVQRNKAISTLANGRSIFYIDMNADLCDENGDLKQELTGDGIHLKASACELWHKFLRKNAVVIPLPPAGAGRADTGRETPRRRQHRRSRAPEDRQDQPDRTGRQVRRFGGTMREMEFKMEREGLLKEGQKVRITEGVLPSNYYYTIDPSLAMSGNYPFNQRLLAREGVVTAIRELERGFYVTVSFEED